MMSAQFLAEWAVRSSILISFGALLPRLLRVKDPSIRLAACMAVVCGSLAIPLLSSAFPKWPLSIAPVAESSLQFAVPAPIAVYAGVPQESQQPERARRIDWGAAAVAIYAVVAGWLLLRLAAGILGVRNLRRTSRVTGLETDGIEVRESEHVPSPLTVGIVRPAIVLPVDWPQWPRVKLDAVLAHEKSHVERKDPALQFLSAVHRALLWHSPLSWMLHRRIVRLAEEASDDAAVAVTRDRASYAEMLLDFMQRGVRVNWHAAAMARYGRPGERIDRILDSTIISAGMTRKAAVAIIALAAPLAYFTAAAIPTSAAPGRSGTVAVSSTAAIKPADARTPPGPMLIAAAQATAAPAAKSGRAESTTVRRYMIFLGDSQSGSWDSSDPVDQEGLRAKFGPRFVWFRQGGTGRAHVITDAAVLREIEQALEPQKKVNVAQDRVNQLQSVVNSLQATVNSHQNDVNAEQQKVNRQQDKVNAAQHQMNRRQDLLNRVQSAGDRENKAAVIRELEKLLSELHAAPDGATQNDVNRLQAQVSEAQGRVNELQQKMNQEQGRVNEEQHKVNKEQEKVNEEQRRVSSEFSRRIQEIFDSALRRGLAQRVN